MRWLKKTHNTATARKRSKFFIAEAKYNPDEADRQDVFRQRAAEAVASLDRQPSLAEIQPNWWICGPKGISVFRPDRAVVSKSDYQRAMEETAQRLGEAVARKDTV
jgi:hypothetical protein